ncbi:PBP1A family penicillin-binding protein [Mesobacillus maritimus]|uniref:transglycosylase domain-containing protein n=1 Tax=Mesobacillus maritimus TaxID=1643336 RepID=UPI00204152EB|nr:PBP1A family penicillin-binding protein [Mesobacillus maritimus]MCM3586833.1 PBP1A family penicillin-binding protein [Mesobacillus maritimus]
MEIMTDQRFRKTAKLFRAVLFIGMILAAVLFLIYFSILIYAKILGPPALAVPQSTIYMADDGSMIGESHTGQKRYWVPIQDISSDLVKATVSIEDRNFYEHRGFDYKRIAGALLADLKAMAKVQGASTITQQYARNLYLSHDKTWKRKLTEAFYTIRLEMNYSKKEILEGYLNTIYYGNGAYGVQAASLYYFGKDAKDLSLAESAMLAGIPKGPSTYSPLANQEKAEKRQEIILQAMETKGFIDSSTADKAAAERLTLVGKHPTGNLGQAPYFQDAVQNELKYNLNIDDRTIALGGLRVYTTLNLEHQKTAEEMVEKHLLQDTNIQTGFISMNPKNGHVTSMIGGRDYESSPFNRAVQAVRQPGSTFKPLLYYAALEQGFTPTTMMKSELTTFRFENGKTEYTPHNFNNKYANDDITMAQALALSDNVYAVKTHLFLGEDVLVDTAKRFGLTTKMAEVPSLALGTSGVKVIEMAAAYSLFANGGKYVEPVLIERVENHNGEVIYEHDDHSGDRILKPELASVMNHMLTGMFDPKLNGYSSVTGISMVDEMSRPYAGKSGSTNTDSWMIGYTPQLVSAVWTGYDKGRPIETSTEQVISKNIWFNFMEKALKDEPAVNFPTTKGTVGVYINPENGKIASKNCPVKRLTYFKDGTEPQEYCTDHLEDGEHPVEHEKQPAKEQDKKPWYKRIFGL